MTDVGQPILAAAAFQAAPRSTIETDQSRDFSHKRPPEGGCSQDWRPHVTYTLGCAYIDSGVSEDEAEVDDVQNDMVRYPGVPRNLAVKLQPAGGVILPGLRNK